MTLNYNSYSPAARLLGPGLTSFESLTNQISPPGPPGAHFGSPDNKDLALILEASDLPYGLDIHPGAQFYFLRSGEEWNGLLASWGCW